MKTLLIVENDKRDRQALRAIVHRSEIQIDTILECSNGEDALYILQNQKIDAIFTDILMPNMDGIELIQKIRATTYDPKIVVVSESDEFVHAVKLLRLGIREYLLKPIQKQQVEHILKELDNEIQEQREIQVTSNSVNAQYLKQMVLGIMDSESEMKSLLNQNDGTLPQESYVVCCLDNMAGKSYIREDRVYLSNVEQSELFIVGETIVEKVRLREWRRRFVGISNSHHGIEELQVAYKEALEARKDAFYREKSIVRYSEIAVAEGNSEAAEQENQLFISEITNLVNTLGTAKAGQVIKSIRAFLWTNRRTRNLELLQQMILLFFEKIEETYPKVSSEELYEIQNLKSPLSYGNISIYEYSLINWLEDFIEKVQAQLNDFRNKHKMQDAIAYIRANYNQDFNMAVVSNHVSMNYSLFSLAFKQYTGTNFVNYLKQIRMEKAEEYLQTTDMRIGEISQNIGYDNEKHFMKIFKAMYGVSPTEYRKNLQMKKSK